MLRDACGLDDAALNRLLRSAAVVITRSPLVAAIAATLGAELALEVRTASWGALTPRILRAALRHRGSGHVVASDLTAAAESDAASSEVGGADSWLPALVAEVAGMASVDLHASFDDFGLDSLLLITLAQRVSTKLGRRIAVSTLQQHDSVASLLEALVTPRSVGQAARPKQRRVLCLHGFRSSADLMRIQMAPLINSLDDTLSRSCDFVFVDAQRPSTGPPMEGIPPESEPPPGNTTAYSRRDHPTPVCSSLLECACYPSTETCVLIPRSCAGSSHV